MSKESIEAFDVSGKMHNSRKKEDTEVVVPEFDGDVVDTRPLEISDDNSNIVMESFNKQQASYVKHTTANNKVRAAQNVIREHNAGYGRNNPEYTKLSNELNTLTQELAGATQQYEIDKASYVNDKRRFGQAVKF